MTHIEGPLNDLWRFNLATNQWAFWGGSRAAFPLGNFGVLRDPTGGTAYPPNRYQAVGFFVSGARHFYIIGGTSHLSVGDPSKQFTMSDVWRYRVDQRDWTWLAGSSIGNQVGRFESKGIESITATPGSRSDAAGVYHEETKCFYMWAGWGFASGTTAGYLRDLWRWNVTSGNWAWIDGMNDVDQMGSYTSSTATLNNMPGARRSATVALDLASRRLFLGAGDGVGRFDVTLTSFAGTSSG